MNLLKNKVQLIGFLGNRPEIKTIKEGRKMAKFSVATNTVYKNAKGERVRETQWHNLVAFGHLAANVEQFLEKGSPVAVEGKLLSDKYVDKAGTSRVYTRVVLNGFTLLRNKKKGI